ncbi:MAG: gliding motility-associated C-terminal domain-containing protein [Bacteroidia bacterium]
MQRGSPNTLESTNYDCVKKPSGSCVRAYTYKTTRTINPGTNGIILAWERCCRNSTIGNIFQPQSTGFTAWTKIPPSSIPNSSAYFKEIPPVYVCVDAPLDIMQDAIDPDGDSFVYKLTTTYIGANRDAPRPSAQNEYSRPPFTELLWANGFTETTQITGSPMLNLNAATGQMTITPTAIGQYVIGYKVCEYRNGILISETRRDYQFNVKNCQFDILANFNVPGGTTVGGAYTFECGDTVSFNNTSIIKAGLDAKYFWDFGDPSTTNDTLTTFNRSLVSYIYPGNGNYTVTLKVISSICENTYKYDVRIRSTKNFNLGPDRTFCDSVRYTLDTKANDAISVRWNTGESGRFIVARDSGTFIADVSYGKCFYSDTIQLFLDNVLESKLSKDTLVCDSLFTVILDVGQPGLLYEWKTPSRKNTQAIAVSQSGIYTVAMSNTNCTIYDTIRVWQATQPRVQDTLYCNEFDHQIDLGNIEEAQYLWSNGSTSSITNFTNPGTHWVQVNQRYCITSDTFIVDNSTVSVSLGEGTHFCDSMNVQLDGGADGISFVWSTSESSRTIAVNKPGTYTVEVTNAESCTVSDTVTFTLTQSPEIELGDDTTICLNSPTTIGVPSGYSYQWNTGSTKNTITTILEGNYKVILTDEFGCTDEDSLYITVDPTALPNVLFIPNAFTPNKDGNNEWFPYSAEVKQPAFVVCVYSRWGEKIFDSQEQRTTKWDGQYKGELVPTGVYVYRVSYRGCDGNTRTDKGILHAIY